MEIALYTIFFIIGAILCTVIRAQHDKNHKIVVEGLLNIVKIDQEEDILDTYHEYIELNVEIGNTLSSVSEYFAKLIVEIRLGTSDDVLRLNMHNIQMTLQSIRLTLVEIDNHVVDEHSQFNILISSAMLSISEDEVHQYYHLRSTYSILNDKYVSLCDELQHAVAKKHFQELPLIYSVREQVVAIFAMLT